MEDVSTRESSRPHRRRKRGAVARGKAAVGLPSEAAIFWTMVAATLFYGAAGVVRFWMFFGGYFGLGIGATPSEASYIVGRPTAIRAASEGPWEQYREDASAAQWLYKGAGHNIIFNFEGGRISRIFCGSADVASSSCPPVLGISVGTPEWDVLHELGVPNAEQITSGRKQVDYTDVGFSFVLEQTRVRAIYVYRNSNGGLALLGRIIFWLIP